jgi:hypothetical protein
MCDLVTRKPLVKTMAQFQDRWVRPLRVRGMGSPLRPPMRRPRSQWLFVRRMDLIWVRVLAA